MILLALALFALGIGLDVLWAMYTIATAHLRPWGAALWSALIYLPMGVSTPALAHHPWLVIPLATGAAIGTFSAVWRARRKAATLVGPASEAGEERADC